MDERVVTVPDVENLTARFQSLTLASTEWTHVAHLCVGAWHVHRYGSDQALERLRSGIRQLNESHGNQNTPSSGYHETITAAYVRLLADFLAAYPADMPIQARVDRLVVSPLAEKHVLLRFYTPERLMSDLARAEWVEPDLAPLAITPS